MWLAAAADGSWVAAESWTNSEPSSLADRLIFRSAVRDAVADVQLHVDTQTHISSHCF
jgi:hypothetical protein